MSLLDKARSAKRGQYQRLLSEEELEVLDAIADRQITINQAAAALGLGCGSVVHMVLRALRTGQRKWVKP